MLLLEKRIALNWLPEHFKKICYQEKKHQDSENKEERYISRKSRFKSLLLDKNFEPENPKKLEQLDDKIVGGL